MRLKSFPLLLCLLCHGSSTPHPPLALSLPEQQSGALRTLRRNPSEGDVRSLFCYKHKHRARIPQVPSFQSTAPSGSLSWYPLALGVGEISLK